MDQLLALRVFVRIAETGAFSRAADSMNIPRPTVTKLVQDLERHLGAKLLQRTTRRVSVTPEGAAYYERATRLIAELEDMDESTMQARAQPRGRIRVDIGSVLANMILLPALPGFRARYPELQVDLGVSDRPLDLIGEGVDCVIRGGELADTSLVARRIAELDWVTCASPVYLGARGTPKHPLDLLPGEPKPGDKARVPGHAIAGYFSSLTGRAFPLEFHKAGERLLVPGQSDVAVNESTAHLSTLLAGLGIGQTFKFAVAPHLASGRLRTVLDDWTRPRHPLHLVYPSNRHLSAKVRAFADWVAEVFAPFDDR
ncbi:LysR substrate-binding domain-containing protein [Paucibacter sp. R3-3]|uniref:LysR substrate-binding domain-containing protein n=1 Tax=Roseateles agri TaxID=3098619 RepID=A0ABU5DBW2_9BURK|nr:LysR substrate-binding domain-containing protein [Paucibacter sp. R3-3]MDY0743766.1 LysR substrate-binding domain-containing protein [Paucibacter sp. R3-3]